MSEATGRQRVVVCQRRLTHYRVPLFERLRTALTDRGIDLRLVVGQGAPDESSKRDSGQLPWSTTVRNHYWRVGGIRFCWQPFPREFEGADLIIVTQENSLLSNYRLLTRSRTGPGRVALWGHGSNFQTSGRRRVRTLVRQWTTRRAQWWFAYTDASVAAIAATGFPQERITNLENATDTKSLTEDLSKLTEHDREQLRRQMGLHAGYTALFLGSLYEDRRLDFLFDAARQLYAWNPLFRLMIVGDGPLAQYVVENCGTCHWCVWAGMRTGLDKARHLAVADVMLQPAALGLGVLDSFCSGKPLIAIEDAGHGPEVAYVRHGENAHVTDDSVAAFVAGARKVITDSNYRNRLTVGCLESARHYTIENMANNFCNGILQALKA